MTNVQFIMQEIELATEYINGKCESDEDYHYYNGYIDAMLDCLKYLNYTEELETLIKKLEEKEKHNEQN